MSTVNITNCFSILGNYDKVCYTGSRRKHLPVSKYKRYRISMLEYIAAFVLEVGNLAAEYGLEFSDYKKESFSASDSILTYKITNKSSGRKQVDEFRRTVVPWKVTLNMSMSTPNTDIYEDFRHRYNNLEFLSNATEFFTTDKYEQSWRYSAFWHALPEDFEHDYPSTDLGNAGYDISFMVVLECFEVTDEMFDLIQEIQVDLTNIE